MSSQDKTIKFVTKKGKTEKFLVKPEESALDCAKRLDIEIDAPCAGNGTCGKCRVRVVSGEAEISESALKSMKAHIDEADFEAGWRLACGLKPKSDLEIEVPESASAYKSQIKVTNLTSGREKEAFDNLKKAMEEGGFSFDSGISAVDITLCPPAIEDPMADRERFLAALNEKLGENVGAEAELPLFALRKLPVILREGEGGTGFSCKAVVKAEECAGQKYYTVLDFQKTGENAVLPALAVDIGTTTVAVCLVDLVTGAILASANAGNAQIRFGSDVINRMIHAGRKGGLAQLHKAVLEECLAPLIESVCEAAGVPQTGIYRAAIAGNTTMLHLFAGIPPDNVRLEPYVPAFFGAPDIRAADIPLPINPNADVYLAPNIGSYVGGDITAGAFASMILTREAFSLFIDLGTNGVLVFGNQDFSFSCACSAGPAFEGGDISCGMRATDGAIEALSIDEATMEPALTVVGGGKAAGLCGSGLIDTIGELFRCGIIDAKGKIAKEGPRIVHDEYGGAGFIVATAPESENGKDIILTEVDIDNFVRAKGAIFSAIRTMLSMTDFTIDIIDDVYIAGGIGSGINIDKAV
ncbi:MAG: ASKHA domain-containing protein, partial [Spirochaetaceae bacterium]|nr:ASKHA domain-containing protein [Spirochaetaceae bacterium]